MNTSHDRPSSNAGGDEKSNEADNSEDSMDF